LGLLNEQIDWKQRFFVPTDEEKGIAVLHNLLARYPIIPSEAADGAQVIHIEPQELSRPQRVNLNEWFVPVADTLRISSPLPDEVESTELTHTLSASYVVGATAPAQRITEPQLALDFG